LYERDHPGGGKAVQTNPTALQTGLRSAFQGRIVTMDATFGILDQGIVYVNAGRIVAVRPLDAPALPGYEDVPLIQTAGTIYPGLIELHNHLRYNILQLWQIPQLYTNRNQWIASPEYRKQISGPMYVLGQTPGYIEAIIRYVECKSLVAGVTTTQGVALYNADGTFDYYRGIVRYAEKTGEADLPAAASHLADVEATEDSAFLARLQQSSCMLLHLSEGTDAQARAHFTSLHMPDTTWAITPALAGIHSLALTSDDFLTLRQHGGAMVWSPLSNMLLYGKTADVRAAKERGIRMALGADWSPSGSKNLLGELKIARIYSAAHDHLFSDRELVSMVTRNAAEILQWEKLLGSIEAGKYADLLIVDGVDDEPYEMLLRAQERDILLVVINGVPRYGEADLMRYLGLGTEDWWVGHQARTFNLTHQTPDPVVGDLTLGDARNRLRDGLQQLASLASQLEGPPMNAPAAPPRWYLSMDETAIRPFLDKSMPGLEAVRELSNPVEGPPLSHILEPLKLDALSIADDTTYLERLSTQANLPEYVKQALTDCSWGTDIA